VLARHWKTLNEDQQRRFTQEFKEHLAVTYGQNVDSYHDQKVEILGSRDEARGDKTVQTHVARAGQKPFQVDYRVRQVGDEWKIIDVIVEGVSLVANFRSQFQQIMASGGIDHLLKLLHEKNVKGEAAPGAPGLKAPAK
jgi:phospholipid transport system substrate-binding protein